MQSQSNREKRKDRKKKEKRSTEIALENITIYGKQKRKEIKMKETKI